MPESAVTRRAVAFDLLIALGVAALTTLGIFARETPRSAMALGLVMTVAVIFRRWFPLSAMAVISAAALTQVIVFPPTADPLPYDLAVLVGMYSVVKYARRLAAGFLAAFVVGIGIVIEVVRHYTTTSWWVLALFYLGVCGGVWLMAYTMRQRRIYVASLEERAATLEREREHMARLAAADERAAVARELHDVVAHGLAVMIVQADGARYAFDSDPQASRRALETIAGTGRDALDDMRRLLGLLRGVSEPGPAGAPEQRRRVTLADLEELADGARSAGLAVTVENAVSQPLPHALELAVYRIAQESITNVLRHAGPAASVVLAVRQDDGFVTVNVTDDGAGAPAPTATASGHGLLGMRERVAVHGGTLHAGPRAGGGWAVRAEIPA